MKLAAAARLAAAALAAWTLSACERASPPAPPERLTVASSISGHDSLLHIAIAQGFARGQGVEVAIVPAPYGKAALGMLIAGKVDLATAADVPFAVAATNGQSIVAIAVLSNGRRDNVIVARGDRAIAAPRDLAGKRLGVPFGTSADYFLWSLLVRNRMPTDAVQRVDLPPQALAEAVAAGAVDAVATWHPHWREAEKALGANARIFVDEDAYTQSFLLIADAAFAGRRKAALERLMRALIEAEAFIRSRPEDALALESRRLGADAAVLRGVWRQRTHELALPQSLLMTLEDEARWASARGYAPPGPVPNMLARLETAPLVGADSKRVTVSRRTP